MNSSVEKLLYSRRDAAEALSLSVRSIDYLITAGRLPTRRVGGKILVPAHAVRRFAREDHPGSVRGVAAEASGRAKAGPPVLGPSMGRRQPQSERPDEAAPGAAKSRA